MGGLIEITVCGAAEVRCRQAASNAMAEAERIENLLSPFIPGSPLSRLNRDAGKGPIRTDPELIRLIRRVLHLCRLTRGALDITIPPLMRVWGFRSPEGIRQAPAEGEIGRVLQAVGHEKIRVDEQRRTVEYLEPGVELEFGALGKGYAIDRMSAALRKGGIRNALISFGSTALAMGHPPGRTGWRVAVRHPRRYGRGVAVLHLSGCAVSTSGDYEQASFHVGQRLGHILDPRTGYPASGMASASVVAPNAMRADALSTAAFVLGHRGGRHLLESQRATAGLFVTERPDGSLQIFQSRSWDRHTQPDGSRPLWPRRRFLAAALGALGWLLIRPSLGYPVSYLTPQEALRKLMPQAERFEEVTVRLDAGQKKKAEASLGKRIRSESYRFWTGQAGAGPVGTAVLLNVIGKERPITFLVAVSPAGEVMGVEVLIYRESQGYEIRAKRFMDQFTGKTLQSPLKLGRDIDAISGATLSARSTTFAVKKALALVEAVYGFASHDSP